MLVEGLSTSDFNSTLVRLKATLLKWLSPDLSRSYDIETMDISRQVPIMRNCWADDAPDIISGLGVLCYI